jgi:hypothetical protein
MAYVEFLAFPGYVCEVLGYRQSASDPGHIELRCRLWSQPPSHSDYKEQTYVLDLAAHPDATLGFASSGIDKLHCDVPGFTKIGMGAGFANGPFDLPDDYVNLVYLAAPYWSKLNAASQPAFPPVTMIDIDERKLKKGPQEYECKTIIYPNDDPDERRRGHRYIGFYAEVVSHIGGAKWNVDVFKWSSGFPVPIELDFSALESHAGPTAITQTQGSYGALYLDHQLVTDKALGLPKLPASQDDRLSLDNPAPTFAEIEKLVSRRKRGSR